MQLSENYDKWKHDFIKMMQKYEAIWEGQLGKVTMEKHRIVLNPPDAPSVNSAPYCAGPKQREQKQDEVAQMEKFFLAEPPVLGWVSPIVFVHKKDGSLPFFVPYCRLNAVAVRDSYPILCMNGCIDSLGEAGLFST